MIEWDNILAQSAIMLMSIVLGGFITIQIHRHLSEKDEGDKVSNMKNAIKKELEINLEGILRRTKSGIVDQDGTRRTYVCDSFSIESSVNSGNFILLDDELRVELTELYGKMDYINQKKKNIDSMDFNIGMLGQFKSNQDFHIKELERKYTEIIPKLTSVIAQL